LWCGGGGGVVTIAAIFIAGFGATGLPFERAAKKRHIEIAETFPIAMTIVTTTILAN